MQKHSDACNASPIAFLVLLFPACPRVSDIPEYFFVVLSGGCGKQAIHIGIAMVDDSRKDKKAAAEREKRERDEGIAQKKSTFVH